MNASLESAVETASAKVARQCAPWLGYVPLVLATLLLSQAPQPDGEEGDDSNGTQVPVPSVLFTAERGQENPPDSDIYPVTVTVEARDNVSHGSEDKAFDALYAAAIRWLRCETVDGATTLPAALSAAVAGLTVYSTPQDFTGGELEYEGLTVVRRASAVFHCHYAA